MTEKLSLSNSFALMAEITRLVEENGGNFEEWMVPKFEESVQAFKNAIDRRGWLIQQCTFEAKKYKEIADEKMRTANHLLEIAKRVKESTFSHMNANPDIEYKGDEFTFYKSKNGGEQPIKWNITFQELQYIIDPLDTLLLDEKYFKKVTVFQLDKKLFEQDLRAGVITSGLAELLPRGEHIRMK